MDEYESAAGINFTIDTSENSLVEENSVTVPLASFDGQKDVEIEQIRGNSLKAIGYSVTEIDYSGSVTFDGNGYVEVDGESYHLEEMFVNDSDIPVTGSNINIYHEQNDKQTSYTNVMIVSDGYESSTGEVSGISFDWIAQDRDRSEIDDSEVEEDDE